MDENDACGASVLPALLRSAFPTENVAAGLSGTAAQVVHCTNPEAIVCIILSVGSGNGNSKLDCKVFSSWTLEPTCLGLDPGYTTI